MKYQRIYFDFDGTLLDTEPGVMLSLKAALADNGIAYEPWQLSTFIGPPMFTELQRVFGVDAQTAERTTQCYREHYRKSGLYQNRSYAGIVQLLKRLRALGCRLEVVTNKPEVFAVQMLRHEGLDGFFHAITGAQMADRSDRKAQRLTDRLAQSSGNAIMVGDRENDVFAAQQAGIESVYVGYGFGSLEESRACGADAYVSTVKALAAHLGAGLFISFEGGDGAGKTTQIRLLEAELKHRGEQVTCTREPGGCPISEALRTLLLDPKNSELTARTEALLYAASRAQHVETVIRPRLDAGDVVLCDRYYDSSAAYQGYGRRLGVEGIWAINAFAMDGVMPARTYYLAADAQRAMARLTHPQDRIERAGADFAQRVHDGFEALCRENPQRIFFIDAACTIDEISAIIRKDIEGYLL